MDLQGQQNPSGYTTTDGSEAARSERLYLDPTGATYALADLRGLQDSRNVENPLKIWHGWRTVVLGSWLNLLLLLIPTSWALAAVLPHQHAVVFACTTLAMIPLVKFHDLAARELAIRIGGVRTGLMNASMSNTVEVVIAVIALNRCELKVVHSTLVGSMLAKLLLVLGFSIFAGGVRFTEQVFDATATRIHFSLLSISAAALLLPAAYHFILSGVNSAGSDAQRANILRMSRGVSITLIIIYASYLIFQFWSHAHLYVDKERQSTRLPATQITRPAFREKFRQYNGPYASSPYPSDTTLPTLSSAKHASSFVEAQPTIRLVPKGPSRSQSSFEGTSRYGDLNEAAISTSSLMLPETTDLPPPSSLQDQPRLSWFLTLAIGILVTTMVAINADWLVESMDGINSKIAKPWVALILLPAVSSIAEIVTAVNTGVEDRLSMGVSIAVGSTIQTALFVVPGLVTLAWCMGKPLGLLFDPFESIALYISVQTTSLVVQEGKSNWLGGVQLLGMYVIIAITSWFYPGSGTDNLGVCV